MADHQQRAAIVGNGPTGSTVALILARHGWAVTMVDRDDSSPAATEDTAEAVDVETWRRPGVPQFHQPHIFNNRLLEEMRRGIPDVVEDLVSGGDVIVELPGGLEAATCRRSTLELAMRRAVRAQAGITTVHDSATAVRSEDGRVTGLELRSGTVLDADLVVDAGGRRSRLSKAWIDSTLDESTNTVYANRRYKLKDGKAYPGPVNRGTLGAAEGNAYSALVFPHDGGTFTLGFTYLPEDDAMNNLRYVPAFEAATRQIPMMAEWIDPELAEPISDVIVMGGLRNTFRTLTDDAPLGLEALGDVLCTTNPTLGRGTTLSILSALRMAEAVVEDSQDPAAWRSHVRTWQSDELWPWFDVALEMDRSRAGRWKGSLAGAPAGGPPPGAGGPPQGAGGPPQGAGGPPAGGPGGPPPGAPLPRFMFMAAGPADPVIAVAVQRHMNMVDGPEVLSEHMPRLRDLLASGWHPGKGMAPGGPPRDELVEVLRRAREEMERADAGLVTA